MTQTFADRTVIITGAGKGLGKAYALYLARRGASVVVNNRRHPGEAFSSADRVVAEIKQAGGKAIAEYSSVEDPAAGQALLDAALENFGRLDCVVANAGISEGCSFRKQNLADFKQLIDINLMGTANILHPGFCHLYDQGSGSMLVSTSAAGLYGEHGLPAYSASKAAVLGLMYSLSKEGARHGVRVNALAPYASTQMTQDQLTPAMREKMDAKHVAPVAAWLISPDCPLNGETIISGSGRLSRAHMRESKPFVLSPDPDQSQQLAARHWPQIETSPLDHQYNGALEHFRAFITG